MRLLRSLPALLALAVMLAPAAVHADGGHVRLQQSAGPYTVTLFTAPEPLTTGDADFSVMLQESASQQVVLDASVDLFFRSPRGETQTVHLAPNQSGNRLLQSATVHLPTSGTWTATVLMHPAYQQADPASCTATFTVERGSSRLTTVLFFVFLPLLLIALFLLQRSHRDRLDLKPLRVPHPSRSL